jgi:hypothetical protein
VKVSTRLEVPLIRIVDGVNEAASVNGARLATVREALAVFPVPPLVEVTEAESLKTPVVVAATLTTTAQVEPAVRVAPANATEVDPAVAVAVPPQRELSPFGVATTSPAGSVSLNASPVNPTPLGLLKVNVSEVEPLRPMVESLKAMAMTGGATPIDATSVPESFAEFVSPATMTDAVLVMLDAAFEAM